MGSTTEEFRGVTASDFRAKIIQSANRLLLNLVERINADSVLRCLRKIGHLAVVSRNTRKALSYYSDVVDWGR